MDEVTKVYMYLLPTGSEEREVHILEVGSIPVAILLSFQYMQDTALQLIISI